MSDRRTCATGICQSICKTHVFDETFGVNRAFNAEVFVASPHAVAMEFNLFRERRSSHWVQGGGVSTGSGSDRVSTGATGSVKVRQFIALRIQHVLNRLRYTLLIPQIPHTPSFSPGRRIFKPNIDPDAFVS